MTSQERIVYNAKFVQPCCDIWRDLLGLNEWQIITEVVDAETMDGQAAKVSFSRSNGQALITLVDKDEVQTYPFGFIEEEHIVKQLLNLRFEMIKTDNAVDEIYFRRALKILAHTLTELKHNSDAYKNIVEEMDPTTSKIEKRPRIIG